MTTKPGSRAEISVAEVAALPTPLLTHRQARAMHAFLYRAGSLGYDDQAFDGSIWQVGVRPWPTMDNLVTKGYVTRAQWWDEEIGWEYHLTDLGRQYMAWLVTRERSPDRDLPDVPAVSKENT